MLRSLTVAYIGAKVRQSIECLVALASIDLLLVAYSLSTSIWPIDKLHKLTTTKSTIAGKLCDPTSIAQFV